jgi:O-antigen ligase
MDQQNLQQIGRGKILLQILILLVPFYFLRFQIGPIPTTPLEVYIYLIFIYFLASGNLKPKGNARLIVPALVLVLLSFAGAINDPEIQRGLGLWKAYFFDGFLIFLMFISVKDRKNIIETIFYSGVLTSALALILYFSGIKSADGRLLDLDRLSPNYLAMFLLPILVLGVFHSVKSKSVVNYLAVVLILVALVLTNSRGAIIGISGALIMGLYYFLKKTRPKLATISLIAMLAVFLVGGYLVFKPDWSDHARKSTSSNIRYYIWTTSLEIAKENPVLGVGLGNFQDYFGNKTKTWVNYPEFITPEALTAHNLYLHSFLVLGLFGFIGLIYFLVSSRFYLFLSFPVSIAIFTLLFYGLVDTPFFRNDLSILFWILMAMSYKELNNVKHT